MGKIKVGWKVLNVDLVFSLRILECYVYGNDRYIF